jgi:hypothetical protein
MSSGPMRKARLGGAQTAGGPVVECLEKITVNIHTVFDAACPGHRLEMHAVGATRRCRKLPKESFERG